MIDFGDLFCENMIDIARQPGHSGESGNSALARYVLERLPWDYLINDDDLNWLDECDGYVHGPLTNISATDATKAAYKANPTGHIDPFELLIDAEICNTSCKPIGSQ